MRMLRSARCFSFVLLMLALAAPSFAGVAVSVTVTVAPPVLPVYEQPPCPGDGYLWTPGYWAYGQEGYYWVPGTWATPPSVGLLWTPGYWGWHEGVYRWNAGYWGPHVGFYGGVSYGFGYVGTGYAGGYWRGRNFFYNRNVNNVRITNVHVYNRTVINNVTVNRVSYNGGHGGIGVRPTREEESWNHERHFEPTGVQLRHEHEAGRNRAFLASENHGRPAIAATARPGEFHGHDVVAARSSDAHDRHLDNRQGNDRPASHQQNSSHEMEHPVAHQETHENRGAQPVSETRRPENFRGSQPSAYRPETAHPQQNAPQHETHSGGNHDQKRH